MLIFMILLLIFRVADSNCLIFFSDCIAATSMEAQEATLEHNFVLFSIPMTSTEGMEAINAPTLKS